MIISKIFLVCFKFLHKNEYIGLIIIDIIGVIDKIKGKFSEFKNYLSNPILDSTSPADFRYNEKNG